MLLLTRDHDLEFGGQPGASRDFVQAAIAGSEVTHHILPGPVRSPSGWIQTLRMKKEISRFGAHVVHVQESIVNDPRLAFAAGVHSGRFAVTFHDPSPHPGDRKPRRDWILDRALARGAGVIFVHSEALRDELVEHLNPRAPIVVVPHGIDWGTPVPLPAQPSVLFFGRISHYKGLDVLLDAMEGVWRELPTTTLTIAGAGEIEPHPALEDRRVNVRAGHIPDSDVPGLFEAASVVVLPYRQASQSGVGSRAKAFARPLVATDVGGLPELVSDGSGLVVPPEDPKQLAVALASLLSDRALARRMGVAGALTAEREGSWDTVARRTLAAYREHLL